MFTPVKLSKLHFPAGTAVIYLQWASGGPLNVYSLCGPFKCKIQKWHCPPRVEDLPHWSYGSIEVEVKAYSKNQFSNSLLVFGLSCSVMLSCNNEYGVANVVWHHRWPVLTACMVLPWVALAHATPEHWTFSKTILTSTMSTHMNLNALVTG